MPEISVIMPVYNGERFIKEAIESILSQTFSDFEFIIINDGSIDATKGIIFSYQDKRISYIENRTNIGLTKSLNLGLKMASGRYIARMDADDISLLDRFEIQFNFLETNKDIALVGGWIEWLYPENTKIIPKEKYWRSFADSDFLKYLLLFSNQVAHSTVMFRKDIIKDVGGYDENYQSAQDYEFNSRIIKKYKITNIQKVLVKYRIHKDSISLNPENRKKQADYAKEIMLNNINYYCHLNKDDFSIFYEVNKANNLTTVRLLKFFWLNRKIYKSYLKKEELNNIIKDKIFLFCRDKRNLIIRKYFDLC